MPKVSMAVLVALVAAGCGVDAPTTSPTAPPAPGAPARIELSAAPGVGQNGGTATITARVQDAYGATTPGATVTFSATAGTLSVTAAQTDDVGVARSTLTADPGVVKVTASVGPVSAPEVSVAVQPHSDPFVPPSVVQPPVPPSNGPPDVPFTVAIGVIIAPIGNATTFGISTQSPIASASWTFGDNGTGTGISPSHIYTSASTYAVTVNATDTRGRTASASTNVTIPAAAYAVSLSANPASAATGANVVLTATVTPIGAPAVTTWAWDCDTSTPSTDANTATTATCIYPAAGTFTARVTVTGGTVTGTATTTLTVADAVPVITVVCGQPTPPALTENCHVDATLNGAAVPSSNITSVDWDFGDGNTTTATAGNSAPAHTYASAGPRTVRATNVIVVGTAAKGSGSANVTVQ